jgi:hypothetical protein
MRRMAILLALGVLVLAGASVRNATTQEKPNYRTHRQRRNDRRNNFFRRYAGETLAYRHERRSCLHIAEPLPDN